MTFAELDRLIESKRRMLVAEDKRKAAFDYALADLIGRSVSRIYNSENEMPTLAEAYPSLFDKEEEEEQMQTQQDEISMMRFKQFAESHNKNFKKEVTNAE